jgi:hypothetical protein
MGIAPYLKDARRKQHAVAVAANDYDKGSGIPAWDVHPRRPRVYDYGFDFTFFAARGRIRLPQRSMRRP